MTISIEMSKLVINVYLLDSCTAFDESDTGFTHMNTRITLML